MKCLKCGAEIPEHSKFCLECGAKTENETPTLVPPQGGFNAPGAQTQQSTANGPAGVPFVPQNPYQQTPFQQIPYQQNPYQQNPYQQNPYQQNPYQQIPYQQVPYQSPPYQPNFAPQQEVYPCLEEEMAIVQLVGENTTYYLRAFRKMKAEGSSASWNWSAFFCSTYWLIYRKMYGWGMAFLVTELLGLMLAIDAPFLIAFIWNLLFLIGAVFFVIYANKMYYNSLMAKKEKAKALPPEQRPAYYNKHGGVNTIATSLTIVVRIIALLMLLNHFIAIYF